MTDYQTARVSLGVRLRELRGEAGLSGRELAARLDWQPSKVSKLEHGRQTASVEDLRSWARVCGRPQAAEGLLAQLRSLETHYASWRRQLAGGHGPRQRSYSPLDARTRHFRIFEAACVPGLLQTRDYATYMFRRGVRRHRTPDDGNEAVRARMERQGILDLPGKTFHILLWEPALRIRLGPDTVMVEQLSRVVTEIARARAEIGVIPMGVSMDVVPSHGFWVFDDDRVLVETIGAELCLTEDVAIAPYVRMFEELSRSALRGPAAIRLVEAVRRDLGGGAQASPDRK
ncbi:helix-turn-helix domain-containing protein [Nocardiopsis algeriensis]|uniref:Transcriptional regulator with XRE-family HTH domain n=1 Tax=Nocardiopsis algeriensis TaxID=1478215 RepID=A0A841IVF4_9ACTN|nr:helix-turn-helix transcriptional regulator [Nocardiopsis algeriensis]MBB6121246.1 transcriptional regulator with XRE-family HTH domain [Nocardiopsis algeriensis]